MLTRIQTTLKAIKRILLEDEQVKKLLYNDSNNALNLPTPDKQVVEKYVTTCPVYEFDDKEDFRDIRDAIAKRLSGFCNALVRHEFPWQRSLGNRSDSHR